MIWLTEFQTTVSWMNEWMSERMTNNQQNKVCFLVEILSQF